MDTTLRAQIYADRDTRGARFVPVLVVRQPDDAPVVLVTGVGAVWVAYWTCPEPLPASANKVLSAGSTHDERGAVTISVLGEHLEVTAIIGNAARSTSVTATRSVGSHDWHGLAGTLLPEDTEPGDVLAVQIVLTPAAGETGKFWRLIVDQPPCTGYDP